MSVAAIRSALEATLEAMTPPLRTAHENERFASVEGEADQEVYMLWAPPENPTFGDNFSRQRGYMLVKLRWPIGEGSGEAQLRALAIQAAFYRGLSLLANSVTTIIENTPEIMSGRVEGDRYVIPVKVNFFANIG